MIARKNILPGHERMFGGGIFRFLNKKYLIFFSFKGVSYEKEKCYYINITFYISCTIN